MSESIPEQENKPTSLIPIHFGDEIEMEECGYAFRPIKGFELEIDGSVYMYSEDGSFEINLIGGRLDDETSIVELNDELTADFLENVDHYDMVEAGTDSIQGITGFLNEVRFINVEDAGLGRALICSPFINQYFYLLIIASTKDWEQYGLEVFDAVKSHIHFHPQFKPEVIERKAEKHPDLAIETYENIALDEEFLLTIEKGDLSLLLAARSDSPNEPVSISEITAPNGAILYRYDPNTAEFSGSIFDSPLEDMQGEVVLFLPRSTNLTLTPGEYHFNFRTQNGRPLQEVQVIIRAGRALDLQQVDLNFWIAVEEEPFGDPEKVDEFSTQIKTSLQGKMAPFNLVPGKIEILYPAMDELRSFSALNTETDLADCSYMVTETINNARALNIAIVEHLISGSDDGQQEVDAISAGSPGMILTSASPHACIVIRWDAFKNDLTKLADVIIDQLIIFSGIDLQGTQSEGSKPVMLNREIAWRLRRHPLFYDAG